MFYALCSFSYPDIIYMNTDSKFLMTKSKFQTNSKFSLLRITTGILLFITSTLLLFYSSTLSFAEPNCDSPGPGDFDFCIEKIQKEIDALKPAHEYNKKELEDLKIQVSNLEKRITGLSNQLSTVAENIQTREEDLAYARIIFDEKAQNHYKFIRFYDPLMPFIAGSNATDVFREINFRQKAADADRITMEEFAEDLISLKNDRSALEENKKSLAAAKSAVSSRASFLEGEVKKTESYLTSLTSKQEELIALKAGGFQTSIGDTPPTLEPCSGAPGSSNFCDPGFKPAFAGFSFGAPHRTGMSQYGAYGRSKSGQSAEQILSAYYQGAELISRQDL